MLSVYILCRAALGKALQATHATPNCQTGPRDPSSHTAKTWETCGGEAARLEVGLPPLALPEKLLEPRHWRCRVGLYGRYIAYVHETARDGMRIVSSHFATSIIISFVQLCIQI